MAFIGVLPEAPSFAQQMGGGLGKGIGSGIGQAQEFSQKLKLEEAKQKSLAHQTKQLERVKTLETFYPIIEELRANREHVGPIASKLDYVNPYSEGAAKRSKINNLRLTLEGLFRDLTLKGQFPKAIYERILKELPSGSDAPSQYDEKLDAIEHIINSHIGSLTGQRKDKEIQQAEKKKGKVKFSALNPEHKKKAQQLHKTYKDKEKVREILSREFEF